MKILFATLVISVSVFAQDDVDDVGLTEPSRPPVESPRLNKGQRDESDFHITWDLGASFGAYRQQTYREINLGVGLWFSDWFVWRNAGFYRFVQPQNYFGIDTSAQLHYNAPTELIPISLFVGPGYRVTTGSGGNSAPFVEAGVSSTPFPGFSFGFGLKTIFQSVVDKNLPDDTQMVVTFKGGGAL